MEALARTRPHEKEPRGSRWCRAGGQGDAGRRSGATGAGARGSRAATAQPAWVTGRGSPARSATSHLPPPPRAHSAPRPRPGCSASRRGPEAGSRPPPRIRGAQGGSPRPVTSVTSVRSTGFSLWDSAAQPAAWQRRDTFQTVNKVRRLQIPRLLPSPSDICSVSVAFAPLTSSPLNVSPGKRMRLPEQRPEPTLLSLPRPSRAAWRTASAAGSSEPRGTGLWGRSRRRSGPLTPPAGSARALPSWPPPPGHPAAPWRARPSRI